MLLLSVQGSDTKNYGVIFCFNDMLWEFDRVVLDWLGFECGDAKI